MPRAKAMIRTTDIMSAAPAMKVFTICFSDRPPMMPITIAMMKNHVEASSKYQPPMGTPVTIADQPRESVTVEVDSPVTSPSSTVVVPLASS